MPLSSDLVAAFEADKTPTALLLKRLLLQDPTSPIIINACAEFILEQGYTNKTRTWRRQQAA